LTTGGDDDDRGRGGTSDGTGDAKGTAGSTRGGGDILSERLRRINAQIDDATADPYAIDPTRGDVASIGKTSRASCTSLSASTKPLCASAVRIDRYGVGDLR